MRQKVLNWGTPVNERKEMKLKLIVMKIWFPQIMYKISILTNVIYGPGPDVSIRQDKTGLMDSFRSKIALNIKIGEDIVITDGFRSVCFFAC